MIPKSEKQKVEEFQKEFLPPESLPPVRSSELVSRLYQNYLKWQKLASEAANQMLDAELAFRDAQRERQGAWVKYHNAKNELPANEKVSDERQ